MSRSDDIDIGMIVAVGVFSAIVVVVIVVGFQAYFYNLQEAELARKAVEQPAWALRDLLLQQQMELNGYRWVDRDKGIVAIPIGLAMDLTVQRQGRLAPATAPSG